MMNSSVTLRAGGEVEAKKQGRARRKAKRQMERLIVELTPDTLRLVDELVVETGSGTRSEFLRNLIRYAAAMRDELAEGNVPVWMSENGEYYRYPIHKFLFLKGK